MEIVKYDIIDKIVDKTKPFFDKKRGFFVFRIDDKEYNYFLQAKQSNKYGDYDYFILLGKDKFHSSCKKCYKDDIGRYKIRLTKELKEYVSNTIDDTPNFELNYIESLDSCDVWQII